MRSFTHGRFRLSYEVHGEGSRVVVLLHGILLDANVNRRLAELIAGSGYRVVLLDLLGHGRSDKPRHASVHRLDTYALQVVALLDELGVDTAVVGGVSLGADVALQVAVAAPERVRGLILEMPVLELAVPAAAVMFVPILLALHYLRPAVRAMTRLVSHVGPTGVGLADGLLNLLSSDPDEAAAVLHGVLLGPIAPTLEQRARHHRTGGGNRPQGRCATCVQRCGSLGSAAPQWTASVRSIHIRAAYGSPPVDHGGSDVPGGPVGARIGSGRERRRVPLSATTSGQEVTFGPGAARDQT